MKKLKWENPELVALSKIANGNENGYICTSGSGASEECTSGGQATIYCDIGSAVVY